jgi:hypothetical protein
MTVSDELMADVRQVSYNTEKRMGVVVIGAWGCTDMPGAVRFFERIDPLVEKIATFNDHGPDTMYLRTPSGWKSYLPHAISSSLVPPQGTR